MEPPKKADLGLLLSECPPALEQLGRAFMRSFSCGDLSTITPTGYQQVGFLVAQATLGRQLPAFNLQDLTPLSSHRVTKISGTFVFEVLLHTCPPSAETTQKFHSTAAKIQSATMFTQEGRTAQLLDELKNEDLALPTLPESLLLLLDKRIQLFRDRIDCYTLSLQKNNGVYTYNIYELLVGMDCASKYAINYNKLIKELQQAQQRKDQKKIGSIVPQIEASIKLIDSKIRELIARNTPKPKSVQLNDLE